MIYDQMVGVKDALGHVQLLCKVCNAPAKDAKSETVLKVCSKCGVRLGEWRNETERNAELREFAAKVKRNT
jgi:NMD protein affecting ribosome stability and mRNA decay